MTKNDTKNKKEDDEKDIELKKDEAQPITSDKKRNKDKQTKHIDPVSAEKQAHIQLNKVDQEVQAMLDDAETRSRLQDLVRESLGLATDMMFDGYDVMLVASSYLAVVRTLYHQHLGREKADHMFKLARKMIAEEMARDTYH